MDQTGTRLLKPGAPQVKQIKRNQEGAGDMPQVKEKIQLLNPNSGRDYSTLSVLCHRKIKGEEIRTWWEPSHQTALSPGQTRHTSHPSKWTRECGFDKANPTQLLCTYSSISLQEWTNQAPNSSEVPIQLPFQTLRKISPSIVQSITCPGEKQTSCITWSLVWGWVLIRVFVFILPTSICRDRQTDCGYTAFKQLVTPSLAMEGIKLDTSKDRCFNQLEPVWCLILGAHCHPGIIKLKEVRGWPSKTKCSNSFILKGKKMLSTFCQCLSDPVDKNNLDNSVKVERRTGALGPASWLQTQQQAWYPVSTAWFSFIEGKKMSLRSKECWKITMCWLSSLGCWLWRWDLTLTLQTPNYLLVSWAKLLRLIESPKHGYHRSFSGL